MMNHYIIIKVATSSHAMTLVELNEKIDNGLADICKRLSELEKGPQGRKDIEK